MKSKSKAPLTAFHCRNQPVSSAVFNNVMLTTVLACEGRKCSLQLKIATSVNVTGDIRGVSVCADSAGMIGHCQIYTFGHVGKGTANGKQVDVRFKCVPVRPAGKLAYTVDKARNTLTVKVTDAPEDTDYNLRLCHKRSVICTGEGAPRMIKAQHLQSSITLPYSKPLPCLCIEGWPARVDARRVQVCPFKNSDILFRGSTPNALHEDGDKKKTPWTKLACLRMNQ
ncbi:interleukin-17 receptor E-like protein [Labeo rohita]|uniref:Interleukin-17 receptor E-like protein n=1 Tax=Labeo rohita TaxID=84645 RepID=A0A498MJS8_LABRO|nr:interleukin-17 receptor E-like protein [Labeo rohita]RXN23358.1 interleukin-17 receptor E-like protein [Labeo rohita]